MYVLCHFPNTIQGYLGVTLLLNENHELLRLVVTSIRRDLEDGSEYFNCLALQAIANIGGKEMADGLSQDVARVLFSQKSKPFVKKKAALTLLRLFRKQPDSIPVVEWTDKLLSLLDEWDLGVVTSAASFITAVVQQYPQQFVDAVPRSINRLYKIIVQKDFTPDYVYYKVPNPWVQVKLLRLLQYYPAPTDATLRSRLSDVLGTIIVSAQEPSKNPQQSNALNAVLFEAINLAIAMDPESPLVTQSALLLGQFISSRETNVRYLGLQTMSHLAGFSDTGLETIKANQEVILSSLKDKDISVRRRGLDLLYSMCDETNAKTIVSELLNFMVTADFSLQEDMVLKIAILAEKWADDPQWYVDVMLQLISIGGEHVSDDVWHRVVQIVVNNPNLQEYAARTVMGSLRLPACNETTVKIAGYILGEYGHLIANYEGCSPIEQFATLHAKFPMCSLPTRALLLTTYLKFVNLFPEIKTDVVLVFKQYRKVLDVELQQRACEYLAITNQTTHDLIQTVCDEMPAFPERESALLNRLHKKIDEAEDKHIWVIGGKDANVERRMLRKQRPIDETPAEASPAPTVVRREGVQVMPVAGVMPQAGGGESTLEARMPQATSDAALNRLITGVNGVLYEDSMLQVGIKSEYHNRLGRLAVYFGNKSQSTLGKLTIDLQSPPQLRATMIQDLANKDLPPFTQHNQLYNVECLGVLPEPPVMSVAFLMDGQPVRRQIKLPIVLTKFMEPVQLAGTELFPRWRQIGGPPREAQIIFKSPGLIDLVAVKSVLAGLRWGVCEGVDPNASNIVASAILHTVNLGKVGCLLRLEPNMEQNMYRLTIRTTNEIASETLKKLSQDQICASR